MERLNSRYKVEKILGKGGMGEVYLAKDEKRENTPVAVKKILTSESSIENHRRVKRFEREYQFLSAVDHPNIVKAYDFFRSHDSCYLVLEFVEGESLDKILQSKEELSLQQRVSVASQLIRGVEVLNTAGVLHRDIKPENIILNTETGLLKILDLGIGRSIRQDMSKLTETGELIGTVGYMSPEQVVGEAQANSDLFSVAVILYQLFLWKQKSPFHKNNPMATIFNISQNNLPPLMNQFSEIPELQREFYQQLSDLLEKALQKDWFERIPDIKIMSQELENIYEENNSLFSDETWRFSEKLTEDILNQLKELEDEYSLDLGIAKSKKVEKKNKSGWRYPVILCVIVFLILIVLWWMGFLANNS